MNKWQEQAIKTLVNRGYDTLTASKIYARAYKRLSSKIMSGGFDRSFETYMALVSDKNFIRFDIKGNRLYYVDTGEDVSSETFERNYTSRRLESLARKYPTIQGWLEEYNAGMITLNELNERIRKFKLQDPEYHKEGSK